MDKLFMTKNWLTNTISNQKYCKTIKSQKTKISCLSLPKFNIFYKIANINIQIIYSILIVVKLELNAVVQVYPLK